MRRIIRNYLDTAWESNPAKSQNMLLSMARKRFLLLLVPLTLINIAAAAIALTMLRTIENTELDGNAKSAIDVATQLAQHDFETVMSDLKFFGKSTASSRFVESDKVDISIENMKDLFYQFSQTHGLYSQIRLIDPQGHELIRIDNIQGKSLIIDKSKLQIKKSRYYFEETAKLKGEDVYVSPLDLNVENGKIEVPFKPMIRFGIALRNKHGLLKGIIIMNYLGKELLDRFRQQMKLIPGEGVLLNKDGHWLSSPDSEKEWGFMFGKKKTFRDEHPTVWKTVKTDESGIVEAENSRFMYSTIHPMEDMLGLKSQSSNYTDNWKIIVVNKYTGPIDALKHLSYIYPLLIVYPLGMVMIWIWAKASAGRKLAEKNLRQLNNLLEDSVVKRTVELQATKDVTIFSLATLAEIRDNETGQHLRRTQLYVKTLAEALKNHVDFKGQLSNKVIELITKSAPLHDIGKVGIPDEILLKPSSLDKKEFEIMKCHTTYGYTALEHAIKNLAVSLGNDGSDTFLRFASDIAHYHHEHWDGKGYPEGLSGDDIPLAARLMALADVYDALVSSRVYKLPFSREKAERIILHDSDGQFDPRILEAFKEVKSEFWDIKLNFNDVIDDVEFQNVEKKA